MDFKTLMKIASFGMGQSDLKSMCKALGVDIEVAGIDRDATPQIHFEYCAMLGMDPDRTTVVRVSMRSTQGDGKCVIGMIDHPQGKIETEPKPSLASRLSLQHA